MRLGQITCPSGHLVVADGGYLGAWSGERSPAEIDPVLLEIDDPRLAKEISGAVDFAITGPDAEAAAAAYDRQAGVSLYDIPMSHVQDLPAQFAEFCQDQGFDARAEPQPERVPHRERVRRSISRGDGGFFVFGVPVVTVGGLPTDRLLPVEATKHDYGEHGVRLKDITVRISEEPVTRSEFLGRVGVDWARLSFADADALGSWRHLRPVDGKADVAFWGRDEQEAAEGHGASALPGGVHGWENLGLAEAIERYETVEAWLAANDKLVKLDFRPHSHHWRVMRDVRAAETGSGEIEVGGARIVFAMTDWGDGFYPTYADYAGDQLVAVRTVLGGHV
ncbi:hypothetical protein [Kibdelosporangium phytohabitans]|uniref:Uncharacterized protein n=1 Tax=Kibdelosporangium phytohabitans TaxID=860235 RepID=A0A0N9HSE6_9PSEU|nr:hypothetical protein [Kibdelosporangium phytohabitans]ALG06163.1 hypothetical protein AOZ06_03810 [Kibdelosporangium phytohabitans]MBE1465742.1 hypothetical protein [Kibdelosporangium phytohabitans]